MQQLRRLFLKASPCSVRTLSSSSVPRFHNHLGDNEEEEGHNSPVYMHALKFQRPSTVNRRRSVLRSNLVSFIGTVSVPPRIIDTWFDDLGVWAVLDVKTSPDSKPTLRVSLNMWNNMAELFLRHFSCNDFIYVAGRLDCCTEPNEDGVLRTRHKVNVKELNFVTPRSQDPTCQKSEESQLRKGKAGLEGYKNGLQLWEAFFANPSEWLDARNTKNFSSQPDFIHKDTGKALWQWPNDLPWIQERLELLDLEMAKHSQEKGGSDKYAKDIHYSWQVFFASPDDWWDCRKNKRSPRAPDFKHKDTGEGLWINPDDPPWIKKQLESLDLQTANQGQGEVGLEKYKVDIHLWQVFFASPDEWWDNRKDKRNPRAPDFKHKDTGEALWLNPDDPPWIMKQLQSLDLRRAKQGLGEHEGGRRSRVSLWEFDQ